MLYMRTADFQFQNQECCPDLQRREPLSSEAIKKLIVVSSFTVFSILLMLKILWFLGFNKSFSVRIFKQSAFVQNSFKESHVFPLLVNLKGEEGPQLARVYVYITLGEDSVEQELLAQDSQLEKHLLFILTGQSIQTLSEKKAYFEKQIQSQINAFLTEDLINGVRIQTEMLN